MLQVLALAAAVEASSEHPVAAAVLDAAAARIAPESVPLTPRSPGKGAGGGKRAVDWVWPAVDVENDHGALAGLPPAAFCAHTEYGRDLTQHRIVMLVRGILDDVAFHRKSDTVFLFL